MVNERMMSCTILATSDIHGHIFPTDYRSDEERPIGLAKLASLIKQERALDPNLLLIDNGDLIQGTPLATYAVNHFSDKTLPVISALNELSYDAVVIGNHEFNYGLPLLGKAVRDSKSPWLSASILHEETSAPFFGQPYIVKWVQGQVKVAILGVTTHYIPNWEAAEHIEGLTFKDALEATKAWVAHIRSVEAPDLMVVAYHGGFECDIETGHAVEKLTGENQGYAICTEVEGIDVLITGHQHRLLAGEVNGVSIVQPGCNGQAIGKIAIDLAKTDDGWKVIAKQPQLIYPEETTEADESVMQLVQQIEVETQHWLDQPIGKVEGDLTVTSAHECRIAAHPFLAFVHQVQMEATGAQLSNAALLSEHSPGFHSDITIRDVLMNFIYPNTLKVLRLTGRDIRAALEQSASYFALDEMGSIAVNPAFLRPKAQHYNYDMWAGIEYELNAALPIGQRVVKLNREGKPLEDDAEYDVVMSSYRAGGGGDYEMYRGKPIVREITEDIAELVVNYINKHNIIRASCDQNWKVYAR
ncbi:bifunctional metallophosphatase/5'-nucleotidase [Paenibacillus marinisediminis]